MLKYANGLIPAIIQDTSSGRVLCLYYFNSGALQKTKKTKMLWRFSRTLGKVVRKGATSGNSMQVRSIRWDCEGKSLLVSVVPKGPACHKGTLSCYAYDDNEKRLKTCSGLLPNPVLEELFDTIKERKRNPRAGSYVSSIIGKPGKIAGKLLEECLELARAKRRRDVAWEAADVLFFTLVYAASRGIGLEEILQELASRKNAQKKSPPQHVPKNQPLLRSLRTP